MQKSYRCGEIAIRLTPDQPQTLDSVLVLLRQGDDWVLGYNSERCGWELPGGHCEPDESIEQTARREALEETGSLIRDVVLRGYYVLPSKHCTAFVTADVATLNASEHEPNVERVGVFSKFPDNLTFQDGLYAFLGELVSASDADRGESVTPSGSEKWDAIWAEDSIEKYGAQSLRSEVAERKIELFKELNVTFHRQERVLEAGCGAATLVLNLAKQFGVAAFGVDLSREALRRADGSSRAVGIPFEGALADARHTPFADDYFDKLISLGLIEHFHTPQVVLAEHFRIIKPGGLIILMTPNRRSSGVFDRRLQQTLGIWPFGFQTEYSPEDLRKFSEASGFKTILSKASHRPLSMRDKPNMSIVGLADRIAALFDKDLGFYSWYLGRKPELR